MANTERGSGRASERIIRTVERVVVVDEMEHRPELRRDAAGRSCTSGATGSGINSRTGTISERRIFRKSRIDLPDTQS